MAQVKNGRGQPERKRVTPQPKRKTGRYTGDRVAWGLRRREAIKKDPWKHTRKGVPDGMRREDALKLWDEAREKAKAFMEDCEDQGIIPELVVPESDEEKAKEALNEAFVMALGPTDSRTKLQALRTVLEFTKQKPTTKIDQALSGPEEWLRGALAAHKATSGNDSAT
jgi:hypothetical protein